MGVIVKYVLPLHLPVTATPFVNKTGTFSDHPIRNANRYLQMQHHKDAVYNKLAFDNLINNKQMFGNYCKKQLCLQKFLWQLQIALLSKASFKLHGCW